MWQNRKLRYKNKETTDSGGMSILVFYLHDLCPEPLILSLSLQGTHIQLTPGCVKKRKRWQISRAGQMTMVHSVEGTEAQLEANL